MHVNVKSVALPYSVEWLHYEFMNHTEDAATIVLGKAAVPFPDRNRLCKGSDRIVKQGAAFEAGLLFSGLEPGSRMGLTT
jgi:hypothetical protein